LNGDQAADVVFLEYQDNNPALDCWIAQNTAQPNRPKIFLFVAAVSPAFVWKALKLGAREIFPSGIQPEEFQDALLRVEERQASPARQ
jgi:AmiR/NasT family two-component response regulator